jgi:hypothetical protein
MPQTGKPFGRGVVLSIMLHVIAIFFLIWRPSVDLEESKTPGGAGPRGGGGGGGSQNVTFITLNAPQSITQQATIPIPAMNIPVPNVPEIKIEDPKIDIPEVKMEVAGQIRGQGAGTGGDRGAGTGTGGGIGGGVGTGTGNDRGPGTGGDGGEIFPPKPRFVTLLAFLPGVPRGLKGTRLEVFFSIDETGHVTDTQLRPPIRDDAFRARVMTELREWTFDPGMTRDGKPIKTVFKMVTNL